MKYVTGTSECLPFPDGHFHIVSSFNSLDHVDDLDQTAREIVRVLAPGGFFLLVTDVNHPPTRCEPLAFSWDVVKKFSPPLRIVAERYYEVSRPGNIYQSILADVPYDHATKGPHPGILTARFVRA